MKILDIWLEAFRVFATFVAIALLNTSSHAGALQQVEGEICDWMFSGEVAKGDAEAIATIPGSFEGVTLCLNSPGGSLLEGQEIFRRVWDKNLDTVVLPGHQCASACAIAFLGGSTLQGTDNVRLMNRSIFPGAKLGFHGPSLNLPSGVKNYPSAVVNTSFDTALKAAEQFFVINRTEDRGSRGLTDHLYHQILTTRAEDMYWIETVGDAILADVHLRGVRFPDRLTDENVRNVCDNINLRGSFPSASGTTETIDPNFISTRATLTKYEDERWEEFSAFSLNEYEGIAGPYFSGTKYYFIECYITASEYNLGDIDEEDRDFWDINVSLLSSRSIREDEKWNIAAWFEETDQLKELIVPAWYLFEFDTRLDTLAKGQTYAAAQKESGAKINTPSAEGKALIELKGVDLIGGDLRGVPVEDGATCKAICNSYNGCTAAIYDHWDGMCSLKSVEQSERVIVLSAKATGFIAKANLEDVRQSSGDFVITRQQGKGFFDKASTRAFSANTFDDCSNACLQYQSCLAFNFQPAKEWCEHFETPGEYFDRDGYIIGLKFQSE